MQRAFPWLHGWRDVPRLWCLIRCGNRVYRAAGRVLENPREAAPPRTHPAQQQIRVGISASPLTHPHGSEDRGPRSEEHTSELQSLMRISYAVFCLKKKKTT